MAKVSRGYRCSACGWESPGFAGRCIRCEAWNTLEPYAAAPRTAAVSKPGLSGQALHLSDVTLAVEPRTPTGLPEFDRVLGGGLVPGSVVLVGGEPGVGKSTLMLQAAAGLAARGLSVAYVCGEESPRQVRMRAERLGLAGADLLLVPEAGLGAALASAEAAGASVVIVDSIQAMDVEGLDTRSGGPAQLSEAGARIVSWSKGNEVATIVTGHVTKAGEIAGPRLLEHLVDAVLYFEGDDGGAVRVLRAVKNRFGATDEVGVFEMGGSGLQGLENPSAAFLDRDSAGASGCAATAVMEGSRPLAVEIQALAVPSYLATPRRIASGLEASRLHLLLAVLARRGSLNAGNMDIVATVAGGLRVRDPGADLAVIAALASAIRDEPLDPGTAFLGEVALSGSVRAVQAGPRRVAELARLGFRRCVGPPALAEGADLEVVPVRSVRELLGTLFSERRPRS